MQQGADFNGLVLLGSGGNVFEAEPPGTRTILENEHKAEEYDRCGSIADVASLLFWVVEGCYDDEQGY